MTRFALDALLALAGADLQELAGCPPLTRIRFHPRPDQAKRMQRGR